MQLFWGDLHNHCGISYGHGSLETALARAREQLDFCSVTGHAFWPDMPEDRERYGDIIDYHTEGFRRLAGQWDTVLATFARNHAPGRFVTFASYEWHSCAYGDQVVVLREPSGPLTSGATPAGLSAAQGEREHLIYPHHIGYRRGYRGINWDAYREDLSPLIEVFSMHGCSESDEAPYPMLHTMGPRDHASTIQAGLARGHRFGFAAGTDHHSAYPGSWGDGRLAVWAEELSRESLWAAFRALRTYAVTGDRMRLRFSVAEAWPGEVIRLGEERPITWELESCGFVDRVELLKNNRVLSIWSGSVDVPPVLPEPVRMKIRVEWGWGDRGEQVCWDGAARVTDGALLDVETCFSGEPILMPTAGHQEEFALPHQLVERTDNGCRWRSRTHGNPTTRHRTTQSLILTVETRPSTTLEFDVNGCRFRHPAAELLAGARSHYIRGYRSEAVRVGRAVPETSYRLTGSFLDTTPLGETDFYYLRAAQRNDQWAWVTPIWVERA